MPNIKDQLKIEHFLVFFLMNSLQVGVGVLGFQRIIAKSAGNDSWMAIILASLCSHLVLMIIYKMLLNSNGDIFSLQQDTFGKWVGGLLNLSFIFYLLMMTVVILRTFIEIVQVWMFPEINILVFSLFIMLLSVYVISGGFRIVAGMALLSVTLTAYLIFMMGFPLKYSNVSNLLPVFNHTFGEIAQATRDMTLTIVGFELILVFFPFIKNPRKSQKWAQLGLMYTTITYLVYGLTALIFYSEAHLENKIWATLSMWKIVEMPFVERFEYIGIATWLLVILPNICITMWAASRGIKKFFSIKQKTALVFLVAFVVLANGLLTSRLQITFVNDMFARMGFYFVYIYLPFLFLLTLILRKVRKQQ